MGKSPINCQTHDLLEVAIVQNRRLKMTCELSNNELIHYDKVLPIDINYKNGVEHLTILTTDNEGGIVKLLVDTSTISAFSALDSKQPAIQYTKE